MKHVILFFSFMLMAVSASAQVNPSAAESGLTFSHNTFYLDGQAIPSSQLPVVLGQDAYQTYRNAKGLKTAGIICTSVGGVALVGGLIGMVCGFASGSAGGVVNGVFGTAAVIAGGSVAIPGIVLWCVGGSAIENIPLEYNSKNHRTAYLAPASSGMGLALNF